MAVVVAVAVSRGAGAGQAAVAGRRALAAVAGRPCPRGSLAGVERKHCARAETWVPATAVPKLQRTHTHARTRAQVQSQAHARAHERTHA